MIGDSCNSAIGDGCTAEITSITVWVGSSTSVIHGVYHTRVTVSIPHSSGTFSWGYIFEFVRIFSGGTANMGEGIWPLGRRACFVDSELGLNFRRNGNPRPRPSRPVHLRSFPASGWHSRPFSYVAWNQRLFHTTLQLHHVVPVPRCVGTTSVSHHVASMIRCKGTTLRMSHVVSAPLWGIDCCSRTTWCPYHRGYPPPSSPTPPLLPLQVSTREGRRL